MKKYILFSILVTIAVASCRKPEPVADFFVDSSKYVVGQELYFQNTSTDATSFEWDFGDGYISNDENPYHTYESNGVFTVTLTAFGNGRESVSTLQLEIEIPTMLVIEVVEYFDEYVIPDAEVRLYESLIDWDAAEDNWLVLGFTNAQGVTVFSELGPYEFYVDAFKGYNTANGFDNYQLRNDDVDFIRTQAVIPNNINWFTAWVDVADHSGTKGDIKKRSLRLMKLERKPIDKVMREIGEQGWKELYEQSVKLTEKK